MRMASRFIAVVFMAALFAVFPAQSFAQTRAYNLEQLDPATRAAVEQARMAQWRAVSAAGRAMESAGGTLSFRATEGDRYNGEGFYAADGRIQRSGAGLMTWADGEYYAGQFRAGIGVGHGGMEGYGVYVFASGEVYEGQWLGDVRHGFGVQWNPSGEAMHAGRWLNGNPQN